MILGYIPQAKEGAVLNPSSNDNWWYKKTVLSDNSVEGYYSKMITNLLASLITFINASLGYRRKKASYGESFA